MTYTRHTIYSTTTMRRTVSQVPIRIVLAVIFALAMLGSPLSAGKPVSSGFKVETDLSWYGSIPSTMHDDALPLRSHLSVGSTIAPLVHGFGPSVELSMGVTGFYTTRSMLYGTTLWRPFVALGPTIDFTFHFDDRFAVTAGTSLFLTMYTQLVEFAPLWRVRAAGVYEMSDSSRNRFALTIPLTIDFREDYLSVTAGVGFQWRFDSNPSGGDA